MNYEFFENMYCTGESRFLQSLAWEKFLKSKDLETFRVGESLFVVHKLPIVGKYAYSPRGPIMVESRKSKIESGDESEIQKIIDEAKKRGCGWIRIEPNREAELQKIQTSIVNCQLSIVKCLRSTQPKEILCMDITKSEEELLAQMKSKTRYNIRLAEKKGVTVTVSREEKYLNKFIELVQETAGRAGIKAHPREHYERLLETLPEDMLNLYGAEYNGEVIAVNMMIFFEDTAIYLHGGSSNKYRNVMAPFLLQWRAVQDAKKRGCKWYDLGGIDTDSYGRNTDLHGKENVAPRKHPRFFGVKYQMSNAVPRGLKFVERLYAVKCSQDWSGITRFKRGFCPDAKPIRFPGTYDIVLAPIRYRVYRILRARPKTSIPSAIFKFRL